jgi:hypothetical protein
MGPLDAAWHLLGFVAPAILLAMVAAAGAKLVWRRERAGAAWRRLARDAAMANVAVLVAGLAITGHDGRMATYAAMVASCAVTLWWRGFLKPR